MPFSNRRSTRTTYMKRRKGGEPDREDSRRIEAETNTQDTTLAEWFLGPHEMSRRKEVPREQQYAMYSGCNVTPARHASYQMALVYRAPCQEHCASFRRLSSRSWCHQLPQGA